VYVDSLSDLGPDVEGGEFNRVSAAFTHSSDALISTTMTRGTVVKPGGTAIWP
jgi:hypothetical protein